MPTTAGEVFADTPEGNYTLGLISDSLDKDLSLIQSICYSFVGNPSATIFSEGPEVSSCASWRLEDCRPSASASKKRPIYLKQRWIVRSLPASFKVQICNHVRLSIQHSLLGWGLLCPPWLHCEVWGQTLRYSDCLSPKSQCNILRF